MWYAEPKLREPAVSAVVLEAARVLARDGTGRALFMTQRTPAEVAPLLCAARSGGGAKGGKKPRARGDGKGKSGTSSCHDGARLWSSVQFLELRAGCDADLGNITPASPVVLASEAPAFFGADAQVETLFLYVCTRARADGSIDGAAAAPVPVPDQTPFKATHKTTAAASASAIPTTRATNTAKSEGRSNAKAKTTCEAQAKAKARPTPLATQGARRSKRIKRT